MTAPDVTNMEEGYRARWRGSLGIVEAEHLCVVRAAYSAEERVGRNDITIFVRRDGWQRSDLTLAQRCYSEDEVRSALGTAGFETIHAYDAGRELEMPGAIGRTFFLCRKPWG